MPLRPLPGQRRGDYINANYIDGYLVRNQYIGAQGPLTGTFGAFWRLVWEQRVQIVVMITNLVERNRVRHLEMLVMILCVLEKVWNICCLHA